MTENGVGETIAIDGLGAIPLERPADVAEVGVVVRQAAAKGQALYPVGGGTMLDWGLPARRPGVAVGLTRLDRIVDYPARDMTITVEAGITLARLQATLAEKGQQLPIDVPDPERATLGGAIAANASGPRRLGYGTLRDYVIGITVVNDRGEAAKGGGRVVKNVAGYDLMKLYTGSFGTLGIIVQATLKVKPIPEAQRWVVINSRREEVADLLPLLRASRIRPVALTVTPAGSTILAFEDNRQAVAWQIDRLGTELTMALRSRMDILDDGAAVELLGRWRDFPNAPLGPSGLAFKASLRPTEAWSFHREAESLGATVLTHAGSGIAYGRFDALDSVDDARRRLDRLGGLARSAGGDLVITRCPTAWKDHLPIWGEPRSDWIVMKAIKDALDPGRIFNPGRFVGGL